MSWGGSVQAMITSLKGNRSLLRRKRVFTILKEELQQKKSRNLLHGKKIQESNPELSKISNSDKIQSEIESEKGLRKKG